MTRKDYVKIAEILRCARIHVESDSKATPQQVFNNVFQGLSGVLKSDNSRFNSEKFYDAVYQPLGGK
jgi:hypothetical protein